jgi:hypothetical protein
MDYICLLDESESGSGVLDPFFVYGGILLPVSAANGLHSDIETARDSAGIPADISLKWNMAVPSGSTTERLLEAKRSVIAAASKATVELFVSIVRKEIAAGRRRGGGMHLYGANTVLPAVGATLEERHATAFFLIDRLPLTSANESFGYLDQRMHQGLGRLDHSPELRHATGFGFIDSGSTRLASALDVTLGAFTRCLNENGTGLADSVSSNVMPLLARDTSNRVWERGVRLRPLDVTVPEYKPSYERVTARLHKLGLF